MSKESTEQQLLNVIAIAKMRSETLEIKDPAMVKIVIDEIDRLQRTHLITSLVAETLKALPTNRLVHCLEVVQFVLRRNSSGISAAQSYEAFLRDKPRKIKAGIIRLIIILALLAFGATVFFIDVMLTS
ncbi:hypothetical protein HY629_02130 [Candidatus Uhrbacteria bacterium]|nr:hypothetical protein [Candidatus Uhrbacteria bacterium]